jgi:spore maturation protein CgeB
VCSPWDDREGLFTAGRDYLVARDGAQMRDQLDALLVNETKRRALSAHGLATIRERHTCAHRVDELLNIYADVRAMRDGKSGGRRASSVVHALR